jgi:TalC/MipB family fructose-6-phosphate aldolase
MELYLDSANLKEIEEAFKLGFLAGLTTTPTFMHREGVEDVDSLILKLADIVPILQIEALGETAEEILAEAQRQLDMGLDIAKTVFKIPVSIEGVKACKMLRDRGMMVNIHLVYTLQQAYMAMEAGATYVCPLVGRLQDQGHDALELVQQCVEAVNYYGYDTKIMFSSVRNAEHIRNGLSVGVQTITVPWKIMKNLTENNITTVGTDQFFEHTRMMTIKVKDIMSATNPIVDADMKLSEAIIKMTEFGFGAVTVQDLDGHILGVFTDGDLRRKISEDRDILEMKMGEFEYNNAITVEGEELLNEAHELFKKHQVDTLLITNKGQAVGMLDIQELERNR